MFHKAIMEMAVFQLMDMGVARPAMERNKAGFSLWKDRKAQRLIT
jgi:hypothetical protein